MPPGADQVGRSDPDRSAINGFPSFLILAIVRTAASATAFELGLPRTDWINVFRTSCDESGNEPSPSTAATRALLRRLGIFGQDPEVLVIAVVMSCYGQRDRLFRL